MREIKFRAMNESDNWVYFSIWGINPPLDKKKFKHLCEYTGLKDKNGKEIYEGDKDERGLTVFFGNGEFYWGDPDGGFEEELYDSVTWNDEKNEYFYNGEIVSNIHARKP